MADRIKYLHINSANPGTEKRSEPNNSEPLQQSKSNTTQNTRPSEPNTSERPQRSEPNTTDSRAWWNSLVRLLASDGDGQQRLTAFEQVDNDEGSVESLQDGASGGDRDNDDSMDDDDDSPDNANSDSSASESNHSDREEHGGIPQSNPPSLSRIPEPSTKEDLIDAQRPGEMVDGPLKGIAYYRTSTEEDSSENARITIDQQKPLVDAAFKALSIEHAREPIKDRAISGEDFDRPGLEAIEELAENGEINVVVVSDIDRLGRICEKTIEFVKRLRFEYDVYVVANVRWYDLSNGDDLETFNSKAGRAEAENKKRGGRGNRGKLFKLVEKGSDAYFSWFKSVPVGYVEDGDNGGIKIADDERREIPRITLEEFLDIEELRRNPYARTERRVRDRLRDEYDFEYDGELDIRSILQESVYTGRAVLNIQKSETHSVDEAQITIDMSDLRLYDDEHISMWEAAQKRIRQFSEKVRNKRENRPEAQLEEFGPEMIDEVVASWTLVCPQCGSISDYEFYGTTEDADGTRRQKCKCTGGDEPHFFRVPTREEYNRLRERRIDENAS